MTTPPIPAGSEAALARLRIRRDEIVRSHILTSDDVDAILSPEPTWIPVSTKLPEDGQECWVTIGKSVIYANFASRLGFWRAGNNLRDVIAWQPFIQPAPYTPVSGKGE